MTGDFYYSTEKSASKNHYFKNLLGVAFASNAPFLQEPLEP